ncbi:cation:dicarboxylate symporter family transporter [Paenibacillus sp. Leaf72]|uniref:cation:dicarboxylate symporter family transporter n=1 Tax=Paenibacillus sp. Leaf72 TaxID=1736234 RepID=UPI0006FEB876|nr:cation:dicarboxylase symporter family transporter [Paenibacillus sp. Leaf72]KQO10684.1 glutamate:protein symporter [Paenibacillus sp. Leaf72]
MKKFGLAFQILVGLVLGVAVGAIFYGNPTIESYLKPAGDIFIRLIKMIVVPIVVSSLVVGIAGVGDIKKLGKLGGKTILYFEIVTTAAIVFGLLIADIFQPGAGVNMTGLAKSDISGYVEATEKVTNHSFMDTFVNIVPKNIFESLVAGDMLAIIFFSVFLGLGIAAIGEKGKPVLAFFQGLAESMFWVTNQIMKFAPIGVFGLIGMTVSKFGIASLLPLGKLVLAVYVGMILFVVLILGLITKLCGTSLISIIRILKDELILAYSTASSETALPKMMEKMEKFGVPKSITSFVIPVGYSFNLDGSTLYQAITALFIAQMYGIHMPISSQIMLVLVLMLTSKGIAGVPGASYVVLLATLGSVGIPLEGLAFIAGIDRILDMARSVVNVLGNSIAAVVMAKWEKQYDQNKGQQYLETLKKSS